MPNRFEAFHNPGALTANTVKHISLMADSDVPRVGPDTPIHGLLVVNQSSATITGYANGQTFVVYPGGVSPIEIGARIREFTLTPDQSVTSGQVRVICKGPAVA